MRELLRKAKPERLDDLIALNALYRPGPLKSGMVDDWVARKQGKTEVKYELAAARADSRPTPTASSRIRNRSCASPRRWPASRSAKPTCCARRWGRKTPRSWPSSARPSWRARAPRASTRRRPTKIFDLMEYFAGYGFNKSHSTAYAFLAYQTAYLKANYPWHFAAALLTIEAQNTDKLAMYLAESRDRGIPVLPPDINESQLHFSVEPGQGRPVRADGDQRSRREARSTRSSRRARSSAGASRRCTRSARSSICGWPTSACSRRW